MICLRAYSLTRGQMDLRLPLLQQVFLQNRIPSHVLLNVNLPMWVKLNSAPPSDFNKTLVQFLTEMFS
jgi:hypothetical protein